MGLLILLFFCHFLADYTHLSTSWMLNAKRLGTPLFPIFIHALVHATLMGWVIGFYTLNLELTVLLILFQLTTHFIIDVLKGKCNVWFPSASSPMNKLHWILFGFDQFLHALVIILMTYFINGIA